MEICGGLLWCSLSPLDTESLERDSTVRKSCIRGPSVVLVQYCLSYHHYNSEYSFLGSAIPAEHHPWITQKGGILGELIFHSGGGTEVIVPFLVVSTFSIFSSPSSLRLSLCRCHGVPGAGSQLWGALCWLSFEVWLGRNRRGGGGSESVPFSMARQKERRLPRSEDGSWLSEAVWHAFQEARFPWRSLQRVCNGNGTGTGQSCLASGSWLPAFPLVARGQGRGPATGVWGKRWSGSHSQLRPCCGNRRKTSRGLKGQGAEEEEGDGHGPASVAALGLVPLLVEGHGCNPSCPLPGHRWEAGEWSWWVLPLLKGEDKSDSRLLFSCLPWSGWVLSPVWNSQKVGLQLRREINFPQEFSFFLSCRAVPASGWGLVGLSGPFRCPAHLFFFWYK